MYNIDVPYDDLEEINANSLALVFQEVRISFFFRQICIHLFDVTLRIRLFLQPLQQHETYV